MKKAFFILSFLPMLSFANQLCEDCAKIKADSERLTCYDSIFAKSENSSTDKTVSQWQYTQEKDEMRGATTYRATNESINEARFGFPYGTSGASIVLRKDPKYGNDIMFIIQSGQFTCFDGCSISVKFDDQKLERYSMVGTDDGSSDVLFINGNKNLKRFIDKLRQSKKVIIEASFFDHGREQFTFDTQGLKWEHF